MQHPQHLKYVQAVRSGRVQEVIGLRLSLVFPTYLFHTRSFSLFFLASSCHSLFPFSCPFLFCWTLLDHSPPSLYLCLSVQCIHSVYVLEESEVCLSPRLPRWLLKACPLKLNGTKQSLVLKERGETERDEDRILLATAGKKR